MLFFFKRLYYILVYMKYNISPDLFKFIRIIQSKFILQYCKNWRLDIKFSIDSLYLMNISTLDYLPQEKLQNMFTYFFQFSQNNFSITSEIQMFVQAAWKKNWNIFQYKSDAVFRCTYIMCITTFFRCWTEKWANIEMKIYVASI